MEKRIIILIAILSLVSINMISQVSTINRSKINAYINETKEIMKSLNINIRPNTSLDSPLTLLIDTSFFTFKAGFDALNGKFPLGGDTTLRFYTDPTIRLSKKLDSIIANQNVIQNDVQILACSILIHEIAHYLQATYVNPQLIAKRKLSDAEYFYSPNENESWLVQCYYFVKKHDPNALRIIMNSDKSFEEKKNMLFDYYFTTKKKIYLNNPSLVNH